MQASVLRGVAGSDKWSGELSENLVLVLDAQFVISFTTHAKPFDANDIRDRSRLRTCHFSHAHRNRDHCVQTADDSTIPKGESRCSSRDHRLRSKRRYEWLAVADSIFNPFTEFHEP
jgi:hypothetical protein